MSVWNQVKRGASIALSVIFVAVIGSAIEGGASPGEAVGIAAVLCVVVLAVFWTIIGLCLGVRRLFQSGAGAVREKAAERRVANTSPFRPQYPTSRPIKAPRRK